MSAYEELGRVKRRLFKGANFQMMISVKVNDDQGNKLASKIKLKNGLITLTYSPMCSLAIESIDKTKEKEFIQISLDDHTELLDNLTKIYKSLFLDNMFSGSGGQFVNKELQKEHAIAMKVYNGSIVFEPNIVTFFGEDYEGVTAQINNGRKLDIPYFELEKLIKIMTKTDLILLSEQILTNGLLLNMLQKESVSISEMGYTSTLKSNTDFNKGILRG